MRELFRSYAVSADVAVIESVEAGCELDIYTSPELRDVVLKSVSSGYYRLVIDLRRVEYLESPGLGVLVGA